MSEKPFEPEITAFMCNYCGYMASDTASALRIEYPANVKLIKLPCTGKTDTRYLLNAFEEGADGVYVIACPKGNCHHVRGNERGELRVEHTKKILDDIGLGGDRLNMYFLSGGQGKSFADAALEMTDRIRELGPNPLVNKS
ncbi:MAG: hydrogenase iron-sulfur subunit [Anaerolineales bacterium]|nr:MAG: hydrogenase iron-sulfur subunit [Anaerolineales bacterium]